MRNAPSFAALAVLCGGLVVAQESPESFPSRVDVVVVDAVVLDREGDPIGGLTRDDFVVEEEGRPQAITSFEAVVLEESAAQPQARASVSTNEAPTPSQPRRSFVIVFDDVHMAPEGIGAARDAVAQFVSTGLEPGDQVTLVPTSGGAWWSTQVPEGRDDLVAALGRLSGLRRRDTDMGRVSEWEAMRLYQNRDPNVIAEVARRYYEHRLILEPPGGAERANLQLSTGLPLIQAKATEVYQAALQRKRATLGVLDRIAESLTAVRGRKSIVLVSEGFVYEPTLPDFRDVVRAARAANAAVYFLDTRGLTAPHAGFDAEIAESTDPRDSNAALNLERLDAQGSESIALDTGGFALRNRNDLAEGLRRISRESRSYYLIGFQPADTKHDGKFRSLAVKVRGRTGVTVRARKGYYAPDAGAPAARTAAGELDPLVRRSLDSPYVGGGIPLRLTALVLGPASATTSTVLLAAEADPRAMTFAKGEGRLNGAVETYAVVSSRDTGENLNQEKLIELSLPPEAKAQLDATWLPVRREFTLAPGVYQARLLLKDRSSGRVGTVRHEFEVPPLDVLRTSTPILTDLVQPASGQASPPLPIPIARRTFLAGQTVYYAFEVLGASLDPQTGAPRVTAGFVLKGSDGRQLEARPLSPVPGRPRLSQMFAVSLADLSSDDYVLVLRVHDEVAGRTLEMRDAFTVAAPRVTSSGS